MKVNMLHVDLFSAVGKGLSWLCRETGCALCGSWSCFLYQPGSLQLLFPGHMVGEVTV